MNLIENLYSYAIDSPYALPKDLCLGYATETDSMEIKLDNILKKGLKEELYIAAADLHDDIGASYEKRGFSAGFKFGARLMMEVLRNE